jgi:hypothetical protein
MAQTHTSAWGEHTMATIIKPTRPLRGQEARDFAQKVRSDESRPVSREEYERAKKTYHEIVKKQGVWF